MARRIGRLQKAGTAGRAQKASGSYWAQLAAGGVTLPLTAGLNLVIVQWQSPPGDGAFVRRAAGTHLAAEREDFGRGQQEITKIIEAKGGDVLALFASGVPDGVIVYVSITPLPE